MLLAAWTPAVLQESVSAVRTQVAPPPEDIVFEFDDMLVENTVATDTSAYPVQFQTPDAESPPDEFLLQAASLRTPDKAEILKTQLRGQGLPAYWDKVVLESGTWYRVSVGPFPSKVEANRALTRLRSQNLTARLIKLG